MSEKNSIRTPHYNERLVEWGDSEYNLDNPKHRQGLIDELVYVGVLDLVKDIDGGSWGESQIGKPVYAVAPPHEHVFQVSSFNAKADGYEGVGELTVRCKDRNCFIVRTIPNHIPDEMVLG